MRSREPFVPGREPPEATTLGGLVREMSRRYPHRPALVFERHPTSFSELDDQVDAVARSLTALGVGRGDVVSVLGGNRPEWLAAAYGAMRIGASVAPMNTWYKADEMAHQLRHAGVKVLFATDRLLRHDYVERLLAIAPSLGEPRPGPLRERGLPEFRHVVELGQTGRFPGALRFNEFLELGRTEETERRAREAEAAVQGDDLAYILYTSGSTGSPKAVRLHHRPAIVNDFNIGERQHIGRDDRVWTIAPYFYAFAAVNAIPAAWTHGACLLVQETFDAGQALEIIERERATVFYGQGHVTRALLRHPDFPSRDVSSLDKGVTGHSPSDKRMTIEQLGVARCCSMYGLTEAYGHFSVSDADDPLDIRLHTQGAPLPGWQFRVLETESEEAVPPGVAGELRIKGFVTSGYHQQPELTADAFDDLGYFRTGDVVIVGEDGRVRFQSRLKEIIKVGGINVSPVEVEEILIRHPHVRQAHVVGVPDNEKGEVVAAFVEIGSEAIDPEEIRAFVAQSAASFKAPQLVFFRSDEQFPRASSGKILKRQLVEEAMRERGES